MSTCSTVSWAGWSAHRQFLRSSGIASLPLGESKPSLSRSPPGGEEPISPPPHSENQMNNEAIAVTFAGHEQRLQTLEDFVRDVKRTLNKIFIVLLGAGFAALADLLARRRWTPLSVSSAS